MAELDLTSSPENAKPDLSEVIEAFKLDSQSETMTVAPAVVYGMSDLESDELSRIRPVWQELPAVYKHQVLRQLNESSEVSFELNYREIAVLSIDDESSLVRAAAIDLLWADESPVTMRRLMAMSRDDTSAEVRSRALAGLGRFILRGEYGEIPAADASEAQELALQMHKDDSQGIEVRCRALEALANSNHSDVDKCIRGAYLNGSHLLKVSALFAMGRTCDKKWQDILLDELDGRDNELVYEAIQSCGHIQVEDSVQAIGEMTLSDDREIQLMSIWALGEIGGKRTFEILSSLAETAEDEETLNTIEEALDAASFSLSMSALDFGFDDF